MKPPRIFVSTSFPPVRNTGLFHVSYCLCFIKLFQESNIPAGNSKLFLVQIYLYKAWNHLESVLCYQLYVDGGTNPTKDLKIDIKNQLI